MHEFNVCQSIVDIVKEQLTEKGQNLPNVIKTIVVIGALRPIVSEYMTFAYVYLTKGTIAEGSELVIRRPRARGKCSRCGATSDLAAAHFTCGQCGANTGEIVGGRELYIEQIEIQE
jgi:hydrogenase nickel incorporation protein HypA/HybF